MLDGQIATHGEQASPGKKVAYQDAQEQSPVLGARAGTADTNDPNREGSPSAGVNDSITRLPGADFTVSDQMNRRLDSRDNAKRNASMEPTQFWTHQHVNTLDDGSRLNSLQTSSQPFMGRRLKRGVGRSNPSRGRAGAKHPKSASRLVGDNVMYQTQAGFYGDQQLNMLSQEQLNQTQQQPMQMMSQIMQQSQSSVQSPSMGANAQTPDPSRFLSEDFLQVLNEHRKNCEREGKLDQARQARKRLKELRILEENKRKEEIFEKHKKEMQALENAHRAELKELTNKWNNLILPINENESAFLEMELKKRHQQELDEFRVAIENGTIMNERIHFSTGILEMQRKAEALSSSGCYKDAKMLKKKIKQAQSIEKEKYNQESRNKLFSKSNKMIERHQRELTNLQRKHQSQRETLIVQRKKEFEVVELRFINVWNEMEAKFKKELIHMEKFSAVKKMSIRARNRQPTVL